MTIRINLIPFIVLAIILITLFVVGNLAIDNINGFTDVVDQRTTIQDAR